LARQRHPDVDPGNPWAADDFKELAAAYDLLSDPGRRAGFDRVQRGFQTARGKRKPEAAPKDTPRREPPPRREQPKRSKRADIKIDGADVEYSIRVDFMEAARGAVRNITMANGKQLKISVPSGTDDGSVLRLKGQGMAGFGGGADGDALVEVIVDRHPVFRRDGNDIHVDVPVTLAEAVLGAKIETPTIDGIVSVGVPAGSNTGSKLRLRGRGLPAGDNADGKDDGRRGDQVVHLKVVLPGKPDGDLVRFVKEWAGKHVYKVRSKLLGRK
jgi:DnaJ-class molecular chaperone